MMIALVDCNSFYASCEKIFRPDLRNKAVVVLSNNDGCIVALSPEAKKLGISRGAPYFTVKNQLEQAGVTAFSSNYTLYDNISKRVMSIVKLYSPDVEVYSIDEAFLQLSGSREKLLRIATEIRLHILQWVGVPVSIGIGPTKTLAKVANRVAKSSAQGVCCPRHDQWPDILAQTALTDVWGIGRQYAKRLEQQSIKTAADFVSLDDAYVKKSLTINGLRTLWELRGRQAVFWEDGGPPPKQGIMCSRGFGKLVESLDELLEAGAEYAHTAVEKLRKQNSSCRIIQTYITTNRFREQDPQYSNFCRRVLNHPTAYTPDIVREVQNQIRHLYKAGFKYKKVAVYLTAIEAAGKEQTELFYQPDPRKNQIMKAVERINSRNGYRAIYCSPKQAGHGWSMRRELLSPRYTTEILEVPIIQI